MDMVIQFGGGDSYTESPLDKKRHDDISMAQCRLEYSIFLWRNE